MTEIIAARNPGEPHDELIRWVTATDDLLARRSMPGGYPNMLGADAHKQIAEAYGPNAPRLLELKERFDADHVFTAIPLPHQPTISPTGCSLGSR